MAAYRIMGKYKDEDWEEIDEIEGLREASRVVTEYRMAFGAGWKIKKEKIR